MMIFFSLVLLQWSLYKQSKKYSDKGIELSTIQKAIERTLPSDLAPDVLAYDHGLQMHSV